MKESLLNEAFRKYQKQRPNMTFLQWCEGSGYLHKFNKEEKKEAKEISKVVRLQ